MRTRAAVTSVLASVGVLVVGWQVGSAGVTTPTTTPSGVTAQTAGTATTGSDGNFTGDDVSTRFGSVQVEVTVSGGTVTAVTALQLTDQDRRSVQISNRAEPILQSEALSSQSASISNVSGATYTSRAYMQSLQSALDRAGL